MSPTSLRLSQPAALPGKGLLLPALIKGLRAKLGDSTEGAITAGLVPFGKVELDSERCSGCGLCALNCPTEAITVLLDRETDASQLLFRHEYCVGCGRCVALCPERCLTIERALELDKIDSPAAVLFNDTITRCRGCGVSIASKAMIDKLRATLSAMGESFDSQFELCSMCRVKAQLNLEEISREFAANRERSPDDSAD